jgi:two-component system nitrate/nitrite sensor histidine kinase NarX
MRSALHPAGIAVNPVSAEAPPVASLLAEITAGLSNGRELETLLGQFLAPIVRLAGAQAGVVRILSEDGAHMRMVGDIGLPPAVRLAELSVDRNCGTCGEAADSDAPAWSADMSSCARHHPTDAHFYQDCRRMVAVALRHRGRLLGLYNLFFDSEAELGADVQIVLRSIGELLGLALHNARLERETLRSTVMSERKFLASEVHDSIAQSLAFVNMRLPLLQDAMQAHDDQLSQKYFADVEQAMGSIQSNLREIMTNFRATMDPQGLLHAVRGLATEFQQRAGFPLQLQCEASDLGLTVEQEVQVFYIIQEALANVCRHAQASQAWLKLSHRGSHLDVRVEDDGRGLAALAPDGSAHFGLGIMQERAQRLGGVVEIGLRGGGGTRVRLTVPYAAARLGDA